MNLENWEFWFLLISSLIIAFIALFSEKSWFLKFMNKPWIRWPLRKKLDIGDMKDLKKGLIFLYLAVLWSFLFAKVLLEIFQPSLRWFLSTDLRLVLLVILLLLMSSPGLIFAVFGIKKIVSIYKRRW